jgi:putative ABC transport system substrate-binding protein
MREGSVPGFRARIVRAPDSIPQTRSMSGSAMTRIRRLNLEFLGALPATRRRLRLAALWLLVSMLFCTGVCRGGEIVIVLSGEAAPYSQAEAGFKAAVADRKKETRTIQLKDVQTKGIDATIGNQPDAVVAIGTQAAGFLHAKLPQAIPLVYCMVADPTGAGLTQGRVTHGVTTGVPLAAQFDIIAKGIPKARTIGMLYKSNTPEGQRLLKEVQEALPKDWHLEAVAVDKLPTIADAIDELTNRHVDVVWTTVDTQIYDSNAIRALLLAALRKDLPVFGFSPSFVHAGALLGIGVEAATQGKQAAEVTLALLQNPTDDRIPRVVAPEFQVAVNPIVADKIGVELPQEWIYRATHDSKEEK